MTKYRNILFCTDFSEDATFAFIHAVDLARRHDAKLHILHVPHSPYAYCRHIVDDHVPEGKAGGEAFFDEEIEKRAGEALEKVCGKRLGTFKNFVYVIKMGSPPVEIIRYAKKNHADLIVMGARGKSEWDHIVHGSSVVQVAKYAHCQVMPIRNPSKRFTLPQELH
ncbi:MAG: universal stress protein [Pseudomonadota bacterium]